jgi:hypothetical protein
MLSKTAMVPASLVGAAALAPTISLAQCRREPRFQRRQLSLLPGERLGQQVSRRPSRSLSQLQKKLNKAG